MKRLIINADDFFVDQERSEGILEGGRTGIITSTSLLVFPDLAGDSVAKLRSVFGPRAGIHLNLTEGVPFIRGARTLYGPDGKFFAKHRAWRKALLKGYDRDEVEEELAAQILHLERLGFKPDHFDSHNHLHIFPGIPEIVVRLAKRFNVSKIRLPRERFSRWGDFLTRSGPKKGWIGVLSERARRLFRKEGLRFPDYFAGIQFPDVSEVSSVLAFLRELPEGATELMCHPGYQRTSGIRFSNPERERELSSLTHPAVIECVRNLDIRLISFGDLA